MPDAISILPLIRHLPVHAIPHNVPPALSSFVGRADEQAELIRALLGSRLVTITGPGGVGKTRLAREIAAGVVSAAPIEGPIFLGGVWWVELAPINDATDVAPAVAAVLGVRPSPGRDIVAAIVESLRGADARRRVLLVLDNCEHVVDAAATLADRLLRSAPVLTILATSREALATDGEKAWVLPPLASPPLAEPSVDSIAQFEGVRLFVDRASAASPAFALTERTAPSIAAITARLDGLPLALELAAASVGALGVEQVASRLDDAFSLLTRGRRTALPRHRTLRALLDWSYQLLAPDEQVVLARLAVFRGRFSVDAAEMLGAGGPDDLVPDDAAALRALGRLVEQSLVDVREDGGETRFRLLETVKQYGRARLAENPSRERAARAKHAAWVCELTENAASATWSAARGRTVARLERDVDEIRAALDWAIGPDGDVLTAIRIGAALAWFWFSGVPWPEARSRTAAILAAADRLGADADRTPEEQASLAELLYPFSGLAFFASDTASMLAAGSRALALWDRVDTARRVDAVFDAAVRERAVRGRSVMHQMMGLGHALRGETDAALVAMDASIAVARAGGDRWMEAVMIARRALANAMGGRGDAALADYGSAVPLLRNVGEMWFLSLALEGMAAVELGRGSIVAAAEHARESIAVLRAEPDPWFISRSLDTLASIAASGLRPDTELGVARAAIAARLSAAASALRSRRGAEVMESDKERRVTTIAAARAALGETEFRESWELGEALDLTAVFTLAESVDVAPPSAEKPEPRQTPSAANTGRPPALSVEVFGPLIVARDGVPLAPGELPAGKATEMLLYLLLHPEGRTKDQIGLALWPDASAGQIRASFHVILHHLRRALGGSDRDAGTQWITFSDGRYRLLREAASRTAIDAGSRIELDSDVDAIFAAAEVLRRAELREEALDPGTLDVVAEALARRRGELGEGLATGDWLLAHADRLGRVWRDGMEALARQFLRIGRNSEAEVALDALISDEPLREGAHRELMALWAATGERARALAHYDTLVSLLRREVGALPDRETQLLAERIRRE